MPDSSIEWRRVEFEGALPSQTRQTWVADVPGGQLVRTVVTARERGPNQPLSVGVALCFVPEVRDAGNAR